MSKEIKPISNNLPSPQEDLDAFAGAGFEAATSNDYAIPTLSIIQKMSPILDENHALYMDGLKAGMLFNNIARVAYDGKVGLTVIPVFFKPELVEWVPRSAGGGFIGIHAANAPILKSAVRSDSGFMVLPNGNQIVQTARHFVLVVPPEGDVFQSVISMTSTQLKKSRGWLSLMGTKFLTRKDGSKFQAPSFAYSYHVTTVLESNDRGSWFGWNIMPGPAVSGELLEMAITFYKAIKNQEKPLSIEEDINGQEVPF